jgi:branched-chain amino acid transport system substrate-binding protein
MDSNHVTRRRLLHSVGLAGVVGLAGCNGDGGTPTEEPDTDTSTTTTPTSASGEVTIGFLNALSGPVKYYGQQSLWGFLSGLAYRAGTTPPESAGNEDPTGEYTVENGDVTYTVLARDSQFDAATGQSLAEDFVAEDEVDVLVGATSSDGAIRISNQVMSTSAAAEIPYIAGPAASATLTSQDANCRPNVFRASEHTAMDARSGGGYVGRRTNIQRMYLFGADYSFGRAVVNNWQEVLEAEGVEIVGKDFVERGYSDWAPFLDKAAEAGAQGVVGGFTLVTLPNFFTSYLSGDYDYQVYGGFATQLSTGAIAGVLDSQLDEITEASLAETGLGPFSSRYHWNQYDNDINDQFIEDYAGAYGVVPDLFSSGLFVAGSAIDQAVQEEAAASGSAVMNGMTGMTVADTPKGTEAYTFMEHNNQAKSAMTLAFPVPTSDEWADTWPVAIQPGEPVQTQAGDSVVIPADEMSCDLG